MPDNNTNPFAALRRNIEGSRLGQAAVARNLSAVTATREQLRSRGGGQAATAPLDAVALPQTPPGTAGFAGLLRRPGATNPPAPAASPQTAAAPAPLAAPAATVAQVPVAPAIASGPILSMASAETELGEDDLIENALPEPAQQTSRSGFGAAPSRGGISSASGFSSGAARSGFSGGGGFSSGRTAPKPQQKFVDTDEQLAIIHCNDRLIVADAFAGCLKTSTSIRYAEHRPKNRMLYICLNKANQLEAARRFPSNVTCLTTHSLAWSMVRPDQARVAKDWRPMVLMDQLRINEARLASNVMRVLSAFFSSGDLEISEKHAQDVAEERDLTPSDIDSAVVHASLAWKRMNKPGDSMQMPHDAYLKMFALRAPQLTQYDTIICDEWQDANPVTAQIVSGQKHVKLLCIGDRHQSIYQFRGSINAMQQFSAGATKFHLSQTFRFGPKVAQLANTLLSEFKGEKVPIRGMGQDGAWNPAHTTTLSRTNAELFRQAAPLRGEGVHWVGGQENQKTGEWIDGCHGYRLDAITDAYHLYARERSQIKNKLVREKFGTWDDFVKYGEDGGDGEVKIVVKIVEEHQHDIPELVEAIKTNAVRESKDAALTLTTVHKSKGLEWDCVRISDDFEVLAETEEKLAQYAHAEIPEQDINLLYVGLTRAKLALKPNQETLDWLKQLPQHRQARAAALSRHESDLASMTENIRRHTAAHVEPS